MQMTLRWFGHHDPVSLAHIRQIPGVTGIVSAVSSVPVGEAWTAQAVRQISDEIQRHGFAWSVVESIPVHEDIKLGLASRDQLIDAWIESLRQVAAVGVPVVCYNFMPVFDWTRTNLARPLPDGSTALAYDDAALALVDLSKGTGDLPGWSTAYDADQLRILMAQWREVSEEALWGNLGYFLERVVPAAESLGVRLAIHPDDPPWSVFGLPRIVTNAVALRRLLSLVPLQANGLTLCTGSFGADARNDLPAMVREFGRPGRIHFMHCRNVRRVAPGVFHETAHPTANGDVDMCAVVRALSDVGFTGPMRPDHGRMIWGETGRPGYGLYDRALGAMYLQGLWEALQSA